MSKRKKRPSRDGRYAVTIDGGAPAEVVLTAVIETILDEIELSSGRLEALGFELAGISVDVRRIRPERREDAYGLGTEAETE